MKRFWAILATHPDVDDSFVGQWLPGLHGFESSPAPRCYITRKQARLMMAAARHYVRQRYPEKARKVHMRVVPVYVDIPKETR